MRLVSKLIHSSSTHFLLIIPAEAQSSVCTTKAEAVGQHYVYVLPLGFQRDIVALGMILLMHAREVERGGKDPLINVSTGGDFVQGSSHLSWLARSIPLQRSQPLLEDDQLRLLCCSN